MYVCSCAAVTEDTVDATIRDGARTIEELGERCAAGTGCGGCHPALAELLAAVGARQLVATG
jgi:bacterioferritin-associated ferredoxin